MTDELEGWITTVEAAGLIGCSVTLVRRLAAQGRIAAVRLGRDWLVNRQAAMEYRAEMERLGTAKYNPWRSDLAARGRGRKRDE